ncbi:general secretion pathway protein GspB [Gilvimarinus algae]|uniref:General secretion pathway protein GspB n=1 Tax=Gilvimarinus algae TaxID=3058037 RepID=A0ABT8TN87_9GAMM|nr:general secretion pathway protein GspB [Gilvimarinus sp. SDUM040014]MDO3384116.1 general secretion pathway protein GspB [Gilvimarinus sp. SDUM040014]
MSLLLDALRKADRERSNQHQPAGIGPSVTGQTKSAAAPWLLLGLAALVLALIALVIWLLLERDLPEPVPPAVSTVVTGGESGSTGVDSLPSKGVAPAPVAFKPADTAPGADAPAETEQTQAPAEPSMIGEAYPPVAVSAETQGASESVQSEIADASSASSTSSKQSSTGDEVAQLYQRAPQTPENAGAAETASRAAESASGGQRLEDFPAVGGIRDLPLAVQNAIPSLMYALHDYQAGGSSRVVLNGQAWGEGDRLPGQLTIEVITEDGVVMRHGDHHFKLEALSSWVNM